MARSWFLPDLPAPRGAVLLVDDEAAVLRMAERALSRQGWRVLAADSGERALERLGELAAGESLAAVVSDMMMPGMDGTVLVQRVRERLSAPDLPALLVSGYAEASLRTAMSKTDRIRFLPKPYAAKQLIARLAETVAASRG
jgi:two-component system cell cycle sensor histidine kinase/response regulator CckA